MVLEQLFAKQLRYSSISVDCSTSSSSITTTTTTTTTTTATTATNESSSDVNEREEENSEVGRLPLHSARARSRARDRRVKPTTGDYTGRTVSSVGKLPYKLREDLWTKGSIIRRVNSSFRLPRPDSDSGFEEEKKERWESRNSELGLIGGDGNVGGGSVMGIESRRRFNGNAEKRFSIDGFERNRNWELGGEEGLVARDFIAKVEAFHLNDYDKKAIQPRTFQCACCSNGEIKRLGETISKGHRKYQLMQGLQLGIRFSVGKTNSISREISPEDFDPKEKFWTRFPPQGSKTTPAHNLMEFRWKDYCPMVFGQLRELLEVDSADYMLAICENSSLRELSSPGKSGSFFYLTQDDRFMIKTVKKSEVKVLLRMLPGYYKHVYQYRNSLITKFFGVHCIKPIGGLKTRFIVMGNLFSSEYRIHRRFDLKGSSHGRMTSKPGEGIDENTTLKDLDLNFIFHLKRYWLQKLNRQIARDCKFLESERIMDYSLLVGLHFLECSGNSKRLSSNTVPSGNKNLRQEEVNSCRCHFVGMERKDAEGILSCRKNLIRLGGNMPAKAQHVARSTSDKLTPSEGGNLTPNSGEIRRVVLHFGIIDILQDYDINKKLEHAYKSLQVDPTSISAVDPKLYSSRFRDFIRKIFVEDK